jgi:hypothetical protein
VIAVKNLKGFAFEKRSAPALQFFYFILAKIVTKPITCQAHFCLSTKGFFQGLHSINVHLLALASDTSPFYN